MGGRAPGLLGRPVLTQGSPVSCPRAARTRPAGLQPGQGISGLCPDLGLAQEAVIPCWGLQGLRWAWGHPGWESSWCHGG